MTDCGPFVWVANRHRSTASRSSETLHPALINGTISEQRGKNLLRKGIPRVQKRKV